LKVLTVGYTVISVSLQTYKWMRYTIV